MGTVQQIQQQRSECGEYVRKKWFTEVTMTAVEESFATVATVATTGVRTDTALAATTGDAVQQNPGCSGFNVVPQKPRVVVAKCLAEELTITWTIPKRPQVDKSHDRSDPEGPLIGGEEYDTAVMRAETAEYALVPTKAALAVTLDKRTKKRSVGWKTHQFP